MDTPWFIGVFRERSSRCATKSCLGGEFYFTTNFWSPLFGHLVVARGVRAVYLAQIGPLRTTNSPDSHAVAIGAEDQDNGVISIPVPQDPASDDLKHARRIGFR